MGITVTSKIKLNMPVINKLTENSVKALEMTTDALKTEIQDSQVVPFESSNLNDSAHVDKSHSLEGYTRLIFTTPYARRWYFNPETIPIRDYIIKKGKRAGTEVKGYIAHKATFSKNEHVNARDHWLEPWLPGGKYQDFCPKTFAKIYKRLCGL